ncbi:MAG: hypothetical protein H7345_08685 [Rubritepida sp.]|nr:hypothetical protein [Rubritepida sp.]
MIKAASNTEPVSPTAMMMMRRVVSDMEANHVSFEPGVPGRAEAARIGRRWPNCSQER